MKLSPQLLWMLKHRVGGLGNDDDLLRAILSLRTWTVAWEATEWVAYLGDIESPYGCGRAATLLDACVDALRNAVRWDETQWMKPNEVSFITAVLAARGGGT